MESWRAVDTHNGAVEAQNEAKEGLKISGCRFASQCYVEEKDPDLH
jgi:hypothetical protein